ncbi:hypothetical protein [Mesorhizobium sp.]|uniref:hypothetical protein n=1 Tax=Mesorhizobium sp. TaxID=1871066 RepID=UPI000FEA1679|nr:hypothetical protein [Mesorhizobium sp.]RWI92856.1 MAG: hypothetical protein EOR21_17165 [Mesorhizobium sp.]
MPPAKGVFKANVDYVVISKALVLKTEPNAETLPDIDLLGETSAEWPFGEIKLKWEIRERIQQPIFAADLKEGP